MKNFFIVLIIKLMHLALKLFGKKGGNLLGKFAFDWNPDIFKYFKIDCPIIAVTATNGKTMTNNAIYSVFKEAGFKVISNLEGNNMETRHSFYFIKKLYIIWKNKSRLSSI